MIRPSPADVVNPERTEENDMDYHTKLETIEGQALAASDSFDIGATADPDAILAGNAKAHILWLVEQLEARDLRIAELKGAVESELPRVGVGGADVTDEIRLANASNWYRAAGAERRMIVEFLRSVADEEPHSDADMVLLLAADRIEEGKHADRAFDRWCEGRGREPFDEQARRDWLAELHAEEETGSSDRRSRR